MALHPIPTTPGLVIGWVGLDQEIGEAASASTVTALFLRRTDHLATGSVVAEIRNAGGDTLPVTLGDAVASDRLEGSVAFAAGEKILLRVTASDVSSQNLGGNLEITGVASGVTTWLTTLARVKAWIDETGSTHDALLNQIIAGTSKAMESYMARQITQQSIVAETHFPARGWSAIALDQWPVSSISAVRESTTTLASSDYESRPGGRLQKVSGTPALPTAWLTTRVEVDYTAGYADVPDDLVLAATEEVARRFYLSRPGGDRLGRSSSSAAGQSDSAYTGTLTGFGAEALAAMAPYRRAFL